MESKGLKTLQQHYKKRGMKEIKKLKCPACGRNLTVKNAGIIFWRCEHCEVAWEAPDLVEDGIVTEKNMIKLAKKMRKKNRTA